MEPANRRQRRSPTNKRVLNAFAAVLAFSLISLTAILITLFFAFNEYYSSDNSETSAIRSVAKEAMKSIDQGKK